MGSVENETQVGASRVEPEVEVPRSEAVDCVNDRGQLSDDEEGEVFEEAVSVIQQRPVDLDERNGDGNVSGTDVTEDGGEEVVEVDVVQQRLVDLDKQNVDGENSDGDVSGTGVTEDGSEEVRELNVIQQGPVDSDKQIGDGDDGDLDGIEPGVSEKAGEIVGAVEVIQQLVDLDKQDGDGENGNGDVFKSDEMEEGSDGVGALDVIQRRPVDLDKENGDKQNDDGDGIEPSATEEGGEVVGDVDVIQQQLVGLDKQNGEGGSGNEHVYGTGVTEDGGDEISHPDKQNGDGVGIVRLGEVVGAVNDNETGDDSLRTVDVGDVVNVERGVGEADREVVIEGLGGWQDGDVIVGSEGVDARKVGSIEGITSEAAPQESLASDALKLENGHSDRGLSLNADDLVLKGSAQYEDRILESQDNLIVRGIDGNARTESLDGDIDNRHEVGLPESKEGTETEEQGVIPLSERKVSEHIGSGGNEIEAEIGTVTDGSDLDDPISEVKVEERKIDDKQMPDTNEQSEANSRVQESVSIEDVYGSSSDDGKTQEPIAVPTEENRSSTPPLPSRPSGLGSSAPLPEPNVRASQQPKVNGSVTHRRAPPSEDAVSAEVEEYDETREKLQMIRVKFLRLARRLGQTPHNGVVAQVLYRLGLAEQLQGSTSRVGAFSFDRASAVAERLEAAGQEPLDFTCTIMVIGKSGVGKSATINSIFDEPKFKTDAFGLGTNKVQDTVGTVQGIRVRVIDTPGLLPSLTDQSKNERILRSLKNFIKKTPPDVIMYLDRLDVQNRDLGDIPLLRTITNVFGATIWFNAIVVLTHAASAPPEGANGIPLSYEMYVSQRTHVIQNAIRQAAGDPRLLNPVSLVENHSACRLNRAGQRVLPNGQVWKPHLLLLSFASKILAEANTLLKLQDSPSIRPFGSSRSRAPPLPFFLSALLQSKQQLKLPDDQSGDDDFMEIDTDEETNPGDEGDYDSLPPFKNLTKKELSQLSKSQRKAYYDELEYREKLFYRKQMKEERKRRKLWKKMAGTSGKEQPGNSGNQDIEEESAGLASVPVAMPDFALPASFDSDYPSHRYRFLDSNQWIVRPVLETQGWDHDVGYEGVNLEKMFVFREKIPVSFSGQLMKDKKECSLQMELAGSIKHAETRASSFCMDLQTVGKDVAYTLRGETKVKNSKRNSMVAGLSAAFLGETSSAGIKIEDRLAVNESWRVLASAGAMTGRGDLAYGARFEVTARDKDYPIGRMLTTLALSLMDWHGDLSFTGNFQCQYPVGRGMNMITNVNYGNRGTGQIGLRFNSSEHLQIALLALVPILRNATKLLLGSAESM